MKCPLCGKDMIFCHGEGWDYDRWICMEKTDLGTCPGEIELEVTTHVDDDEDS